MSYEVVYPITDRERVNEVITKIVVYAKKYFEGKFGETITKKLVNHKKGRAFCDFIVTTDSEEYFSFIMIISGFDGAELVRIEAYPFNLNENGRMIPIKMLVRGAKQTNRPYFLLRGNKVCMLNAPADIGRIRIKRRDLFDLITNGCESYEVI